MARSKKTSRGSVTATATVATPWERNRVVLQATRKINTLERDIAGKVVDAVVAAGSLLAQVQDELPRGEWLRWLGKGVHFDVRTAERYMAVEHWARTRPREFARIRAVSITKVYRLLQLAPDDRRRLVDRRVRIPDTDLRLRLEEMTMAHLDRVIRDMITPPPAEDPVPELLRAARHRLAGFEAQAAELIEHRADVDPADIAALHTQLVDVTHRLERAFRL